MVAGDACNQGTSWTGHQAWSRLVGAVAAQGVRLLAGPSVVPGAILKQLQGGRRLHLEQLLDPLWSRRAGFDHGCQESSLTSDTPTNRTLEHAGQLLGLSPNCPQAVLAGLQPGGLLIHTRSRQRGWRSVSGEHAPATRPPQGGEVIPQQGVKELVAGAGPRTSSQFWRAGTVEGGRVT
jgi:hypothetical protein